MGDGLYVGLMSGTSVDGIDAVLVEFRNDNIPRLLASTCEAMSPGVREQVLALCQPGDNEIDRLGELDVQLSREFARAALSVIRLAGVSADHVIAIGSHGQTIRHRPVASCPFTLQLGDPNGIAEMTGITTVADFRRRDVAAGGQGAPLVPAFHDAVFRAPDEDRIILNLGGMANVSVLDSQSARSAAGFDTGPGNVLLDAWHERHRGAPVDRDGAWARAGSVHGGLLETMLREPYFNAPPPKSTGRELFNLAWLDDLLADAGDAIAAQDVQATLVELTALSAARAITAWGTSHGGVYLCGGGTHNRYLRERLAAVLPSHRVASTADLGVAPDWVEAVAFAWLARRTLAGLPGNLPAVTGARHAVVLGGIYPGRRSGRSP